MRSIGDARFNRRTVFFENEGRRLRPVASGEPTEQSASPDADISPPSVACIISSDSGIAIGSESTYGMFATGRPSSVLACYV